MATAPTLARPFDITTGWPIGASRAASTVRPPVDLLRVLRDAMLIVMLLLINKGGNAGAAVFFGILALMVLKSPQAAFKALAICWLGLMINTAFVPKSIFWTPARLALPLLAFIRFSIDIRRVRATLLASPMYVAFVAYVLIMAVCSIMSGWYTQIALIKLANYWAVVSAILAGVMVLRRTRVDMTEWFVSLIMAATLLGLASIALGVDNNFRRSLLAADVNVFVGAFLHPNCHSVYAALFVIFLAAFFMLGDYPRRKLAIPLMAIWVVFMIWSKARASILATLVGLVVLVILAKPIHNRFGWRLRINVRRSTLFAGLVLAAFLTPFVDFAAGGAVTRAVVAFIAKNEGVDATGLNAEQVMASRKGLIDRAFKNFSEHPLFGIGFQVSTDDSFIANATLFTAPVEKGVIFAAVLEEGGVVGTIAFVFFLLTMVLELLQSRNIPALTVLAAYLGSNLGEVTFFSPGGAGAFGWIMIGAAMILGDHCWHRVPTPWPAIPQWLHARQPTPS